MKFASSGFVICSIILLGCILTSGCTDNRTSPPETTPGCDISDTRIIIPKNISADTIPPALRPQCNDCTPLLLTSPMGGFSGNRLLVPLYTYQRNGRELNPDPTDEINYTFYSRTMKTGKVRYQISHVGDLYDMQPQPMPANISVVIEPDEFVAEPGRTYTSKVTVRLKPATNLYENFWIHVHADVEGAPDAITDDWVRLAVDNGQTLSGSGLTHFYTGRGGYCEKMLVLRQGDSGQSLFAVQAGELDTGNVTLSFVTIPCTIDHGPIGADERPPLSKGIEAGFDPDQFTSRSFSRYFVKMKFRVDTTVPLGDYCFSAILRTPTGGGDYSPFMLRVIQR